MPEPLITPALRHRSGRAPRLPACSVRRGLVLLLAGLWTGLARAHEFNAGDIVIEHPYALPTLPGVTTGAVYFRSLRNAGHAPERLLGARTDVAASVQLTRGLAPGGAAPRTVLSSIDLPAGVELKFRHDGDTRLTLVGLKAPLKIGDRFAITLRFEHGGEREITVWVQQPRETAGARGR